MYISLPPATRTLYPSLHNIQHKTLRSRRCDFPLLVVWKDLSQYRILHRQRRKDPSFETKPWRHIRIFHCIDDHEIEIFFILLRQIRERSFVLGALPVCQCKDVDQRFPRLCQSAVLAR